MSSSRGPPRAGGTGSGGAPRRPSLPPARAPSSSKPRASNYDDLDAPTDAYADAMYGTAPGGAAAAASLDDWDTRSLDSPRASAPPQPQTASAIGARRPPRAVSWAPDIVVGAKPAAAAASASASSNSNVGGGEALVDVLDGLLARDSLLQAAEIDKASGHGMSGRVAALRSLCDRLQARTHRLLDVAMRDFLINMRSHSGSLAAFRTNMQHVWQTWTVKDARDFARVILDLVPEVIWVVEMRISSETALLAASEFLPHDLGPISHPEFKRSGTWSWPPLTPVLLDPYRFFERLARIVARSFYHHTLSATYRDNPWDMDRVQALVSSGLDDALDEFVPLPVPSERSLIDAASTHAKAQQQTHPELARMLEHRAPWLTALDTALKSREAIARDADEWFKKQRVAGSRVSDYCLRAEQAQATRDANRQQAISRALAEAAPLIGDRIAERAPSMVGPVLAQLGAICESSRHATQVLQHLHTAVHQLAQQHAQLAAQLAARPIPAPLPPPVTAPPSLAAQQIRTQISPPAPAKTAAALPVGVGAVLPAAALSPSLGVSKTAPAVEPSKAAGNFAPSMPSVER
jgi:hypothetical protein